MLELPEDAWAQADQRGQFTKTTWCGDLCAIATGIRQQRYDFFKT